MVLSGGISSPLSIDLKPMDPREESEFLAQGGMAAIAEEKRTRSDGKRPVGSSAGQSHYNRARVRKQVDLRRKPGIDGVMQVRKRQTALKSSELCGDFRPLQGGIHIRTSPKVKMRLP